MYWLVKSEPGTFSIHNLAARPDQTDHWDGVRNYQARNFMRDEMKSGDQVLFYHSNCNPPGVAGVCEVVTEGYPDHTSWDPEGKYFDPKSTPESPRWFMVDLQLKEIFPRFVPLDKMKENPQLDTMQLLKKGNRLSVMPVLQNHFFEILRMGGST
ncbi:MAG: EVE domain-containing protein [Spirochaeta sp.]